MRVRAIKRLVAWAAVAAVATALGSSARADDTSPQDPANLSLQGASDTKLERSNKKWAQGDTCGKASFRKFPDFTVEGAANRDVYMRECLRKNRLPPRNDLARPLPPRGQ